MVSPPKQAARASLPLRNNAPYTEAGSASAPALFNRAKNNNDTTSIHQQPMPNCLVHRPRTNNAPRRKHAAKPASAYCESLSSCQNTIGWCSLEGIPDQQRHECWASPNTCSLRPAGSQQKVAPEAGSPFLVRRIRSGDLYMAAESHAVFISFRGAQQDIELLSSRFHYRVTQKDIAATEQKQLSSRRRISPSKSLVR